MSLIISETSDIGGRLASPECGLPFSLSGGSNVNAGLRDQVERALEEQQDHDHEHALDPADSISNIASNVPSPLLQ